MKLLYLPNENIEGDQVGPRMAFEKLFNEGVFSAYKAYPYLLRKREIGNHLNALQDLLETATSFQPDVIFTQHLTDAYPVDRDFLRKLKNLPSKPKLVVHEGDAYGEFIKRMDCTMRVLLSESDMAILVGTGNLADIAKKSGADCVRFAPHSYDSKRFGSAWMPTLARTYNAIMIANLPCIKRIPWLHMPGGRERKQTARELYHRLGKNFVVFGGGQGWKGEPYAKGLVDFDKQGEAIRDAWMSVNWHQFDNIAMYSSDRLPISLACGVPHITNYQLGYEHIFGEIPGLFIVDRPKDAADVATYLMSLPVSRRNELGAAAANYAREHLEATKVYADIVAIVREQLFGLPDWRQKKSVAL